MKPSTTSSPGAASFSAARAPSAPPRYRWVILAGVWLLYLVFGLTITSLAPLTTLIETDLDFSHSAMGSIMGAWQLVFIFSAVPIGMFLDRIGPRWALVIGGLFISGSNLLRGSADSYTELLLAVMLFGLCGPIISSGAPKVVTALFSGSTRGLAMGIYMTGPAIGGIISLTFTHSLLLPHLDNGWRSVTQLWGLVALAATFIWLLITCYPLLERTSSANASGPALPQTQVLKKLLSNPAVVLVMLMGAGAFVFNHSLLNWLPELLRNTGLDMITAGYWAAIPTAVGIVGSLLIPRLATPERRLPILIGLALCATGASLLLHFQQGPLLFSGLLLQGLARSSLMTVLMLTLMELPGVGERYAGVASGLFFSTAEVGGVLGPLSLGLLYDLTGNFDAGLYLLTAMTLLLVLGSARLKHITQRAVNKTAIKAAVKTSTDKPPGPG